MHANPGFYDLQNLENLYHIYETMQNDLNLRFKIEPLIDDDIQGFHDAVDIRFQLVRQMISNNLNVVPEAQNWPESEFDDYLDNYTVNNIYPIFSSKNYAIYRLDTKTGLYQTILDWYQYTDNPLETFLAQPFAQFKRNDYLYILSFKDDVKMAKQLLSSNQDGVIDYFTKFFSTDTPINKRSKKAYAAYEEHQGRLESSKNDEKEKETNEKVQ